MEQQIKINKNDVGIRIDKFLLKIYPNLKRNNLYRLFRNKKIKVNKNKVDINYRLVLNDIVSIYTNINQSFKNNEYLWLESKNDLDIIYEDNNIIVVNKPVGLLSHDDKNKSTNDTLINRIKKYLYIKKEYQPEIENHFSPSLAHRLDRNTSGIIIAAKNHESLISLENIFKHHNLSKTYIALVHGTMQISNSFKNIQLYLRDNQNGYVSVSKSFSNDSKLSISQYKVIANITNKYSLVIINLITGRKHQIRATFNYLNHPVVGEKKYISKNIDKSNQFKYQCLIAKEIKLNINNSNDHLFYLNNKIFKINKIWFLDLINYKY